METYTYRKIKKYLKDIIKGSEFENNLYAVGGCCRDEYLKLPIKDIDLVVSLENGGIKFAEWLESKNLTTGSVITYQRYGTAMFRLKEFPDEEIEVVQTRTEIYESDSRKPETKYGSLYEDALRRDFTVNALYYDISNEKMLDVIGTSFQDIKAKFIITPTDPNITFADDPLRMLRCIRFACRLNWQISDEAFQTICENVDRLYIISAERITSELMKILNTGDAYFGISKCIESGIMKYMFPSVNSVEECINYFTNPVAKLLCLNVYNPNVKEELEDLKFPNNIIKYITTCQEIINDSKVKMSKYRYRVHQCRDIRKCACAAWFEEIISICSYMGINTDLFPYFDDREYEHIINYNLPIDGNDIMEALEIEPCRLVQIAYDFCLDKVFQDNKEYTKEELIKFIKERFSK